MVELLFLYTLSRGMRDGFLTLPSLGQAAGVCNEDSMVRYICLPIYGNTVRKTSQPLKDECLYSISRTAPLNLGYYNTVQPPSGRNQPRVLPAFVPVRRLSYTP